MIDRSRQVAIESARSLLFVPGNRPDRFGKADASGADVVILDLEDAVAPGEKAASRVDVVGWALSHENCLVRVNGLGTPWIHDELRALRASGVPVMLPKADSAQDLQRVHDELAGSPVVALVETPQGVASVQALAASGAVVRLVLGNVDLAAGLGVDPASHNALSFARGSLVLASALAGLAAPVDGVSTRIDDQEGLEADVAHGREMGFGGKLCIHPRQVATVNASMSPSAEELHWARNVLSARGDGVKVVDGAMVDPPVLARAAAIVARADRD